MGKGERAKEDIEQRTQSTGVVSVWELDMSSYLSVDRFADRVDQELNHLDAVVLNAGIVSRYLRVSPEDWNKMLQVNLLSTALLSILLLPKLKASETTSSTAHLAIVSSTGHKNVKVKAAARTLRLHSYNHPETYNVFDQHMISKLFMMWITRAVRELNGEPQVIINDLCPGACQPDVAREFDNAFFRVLKVICNALLFRTAERGSRRLVGATTMGKESHGKWIFSDDIAL